MKVAILLLLVSTSFVASLYTKEQLESLHLAFDHYTSHFEKTYSSEEEYQYRQAIYIANLEKIKEINADQTNTWKAGINEFTDRTAEEMKSLQGYNRDLAFSRSSLRSSAIPDKLFLKEAPESIDWRKLGKVTPVKNQGGCGSCWTFSATATLEAHVAVATGKLLDLSEQQLVSCVENPQHCGGTGGCEGATQELAFAYVKEKGLTTGDKYRYQGRDTPCNHEAEAAAVVNIDGFVQLKVNDYEALTQAVGTLGPIAISIDATPMQFYSSGVINDKASCTNINHAVTLVGYGEEAGKKFWIIKNSWGKGWGEDGYVRVARENSSADVKCRTDKHPEQGSGCDGGPTEIQVCGVCGMYVDSTYPLGVKLR